VKVASDARVPLEKIRRTFNAAAYPSFSTEFTIGRRCPFRKPYAGGFAPDYGIGACSLAMVVILKLLIGVLRRRLLWIGVTAFRKGQVEML
jgi:hypothetical protein